MPAADVIHLKVKIGLQIIRSNLVKVTWIHVNMIMTNVLSLIRVKFTLEKLNQLDFEHFSTLKIRIGFLKKEML